MTLKRNFKLSLLSASTLALSAAAFAQTADAPAATEDEARQDVVVVTGIRSSLKAASELKRNDSRIIDAIVAEDIGKLPDNNIAEALQRVTGVSINREYGVGNAVSIRGLSDNRVEINGRTTLGDSRNGISFDDMPSSFVSAVEVIKSPTPEMIEGALGGTINMKTVRPLDLNGRTIAGAIDLEYADKTENVAPIFNVTAGDSWDLGNGGAFGVVASLSYQDRELRQDTFQQDLRVQDGFDINNDGIIDAADDANTPSGNYVISREHKYEPWVEHRERTAANLSFQYAPNERGDVYLDLNFTEREGGEEAYSVLMAGGNATNANGTATVDGNGQLSGYVLEGAFILPKTWSEFRSTKSFSHALGGQYDLTDNLNVSFEYSTAESDQVEPKTEFNWRAHDPVAEALDPASQNRFFVDALIDTSSHDQVPGVTFVGQPDIYLNQDMLALREFRHTTDDITNSEDAIRFDVEYNNPFNLGWVTAIKAGYRNTDREYERSSAEFRTANLHQDLVSATDPTDYIVITMAEFNAAYPGTLVTPYQPGDLFGQAGYASANQTAPFTLYDAALLSEDLEGSFQIISELLQGTNREVSGSLASNLSFNQGSYAKIAETTDAFYVQGDLDFDMARVVLGARLVETEITSSAFQDGAIVSDTETYDDLLPSINVTVDLNDNTLLRASGAKVMRRADFGDLSPAYDFNSDIITATRGAPGLEPFRATQFDFGVEHYWGEGNFISATIFYKDVASFFKETQYCAYLPNEVVNQNLSIPSQICILPAGVQADSTVFSSVDDGTVESDPAFQALVAAGRNGVTTTTKTNGASGTIQGFEIGTVYNFDYLPGLWSGFGINANYTRSESEDPDGRALEDISKNSYNFQVFWEYDAFSARLAYTHRDEFLEASINKRTEHIGELLTSNDVDLVNDPTQGNSFRDGISQLDASASWDVNDWLTVVANATNLTGEPLINSSVTGTAWQVQESDRRFSIGARAKF